MIITVIKICAERAQNSEENVDFLIFGATNTRGAEGAAETNLGFDLTPGKQDFSGFHTRELKFFRNSRHANNFRYREMTDRGGGCMYADIHPPGRPVQG